MAPDNPEKKRKRLSEKHDRPSKKPALQAVKPPVKVQFIQNPDGPVPIVASTPGLTVPESLTLTTYDKPAPANKKRTQSASKNSTLTSSELLLHSSSHPKLDFTGKEGENELDSLWSHYVAIYDADSGTMQIMEARKMTVRGCVRQISPVVEEEETDDEGAAKTRWSQRTALTEAFGTKQARKSVQSIAENALIASSSNPSGTPTTAESALLSSMPNDKAQLSAQKSAAAEIQAAKPLPQPDLSATHPVGVYTLESLIPNGLSTLRALPIHDWQDAVNAGEPVLTSSRFVSNRIESVVGGGNKTTIQLLRYIWILIEFSRCLKSAGRGSNSAGPGSRKLPARDELRTVLSATLGTTGKAALLPDSFLDSLRRKFAPQGSFLSKTDITFLHTTICALTLHIPPAAGNNTATELATDPSDLRDDLRLENKDALQYFRELGCRVDKIRESEFVKWGVKTKAEAAAKRVARLRLPVEFPRLSRGGGGGRR
ncbi:hypothetical protein AJ80_02548 [Polytolypa hystricis UAMH7299]|uniref:DNA-directed RNA polymerase I subunit RPA49 n=1 Tax=Polytolypa hystricis (strain UAMH7299) TaxID=1447883 RepID=A0A2B7YRD2_POLH7|nr:hypothetical protein AJ80_02548 [Polytolypa hystricis UAMH7299]